MSTRMERVYRAAGSKPPSFFEGWRNLEYKGYKVPIPNDYWMMKAANYVAPVARQFLREYRDFGKLVSDEL